MKQWRGFSSHHGWKLFWIHRLLIKLSCCFGTSETYNAEMAWFLCQEVVAAYIHQPSHPVCRILLTSFSNRLLCHLFEEGTGIFESVRVVMFNVVHNTLSKLRDKVEKQTTSTTSDAMDLLYYLVSMMMLTCGATKRANLLACYQLISSDRLKSVTLLRRSPDIEDHDLADEMERLYSSEGASEDPLYSQVVSRIQLIQQGQDTKQGWISGISGICNPLNRTIPGFSAAMESLIGPWYYKRDRAVFTYGTVLISLISNSPQTLPDLPSRTPFDIYSSISEYVLNSIEDRTSPLVTEVVQLMDHVPQTQTH